MLVRRLRPGRTPVPGQGGSAGKAWEKKETRLWGPSDLQETGGHRALRDHTQEGSLPCSRPLSKHPAGKASGLEPETRPLSTGPPGSGPAHSGLDAHGAPRIAPGPHAGERKACLSATPPALQGLVPLPPPIHQEAEQHPWAGQAAHSRPADARPGGDRWLAPNAWFSLLVCVSREQPHVKRENTPPSKTWLFLCRQKGWAANSLSPGHPGAEARSPAGVCVLPPLRAQPHLPPGPKVVWPLCWGWGQGKPRAWWTESPRPPTQRQAVCG